MQSLETILQSVGISERAIQVYLRLLDTGPASARQLADNLSIPRPSVYDHLKLLVSNDLVIERQQENKRIFAVGDTNVIQHLLRDKIKSLEDSTATFTRLLPTLQVQAKSIEPKIKFYVGVDGIKSVLRDLLWYENIETYTMWPISDMVHVLGREYLEQLNRKRIRNRISIKGVWPSDKIVSLQKYPFLGTGKGHLRELRVAPPQMTWSMSYWLYADKAAFISSKKEVFGFLVHSQDFAELMKMQFDAIWSLAKPLPKQPPYIDDFLRTV
ncbi:MAG: hypothetical protein COU33_02435 [Candidatus Magasanikbacteria bacterium CG10_big_fil_rev_8_21_14_0_10_43_6]|uniref:Transcription regulator TrmB N-terminal domain-containing protein n=1 Tax=Candidatus Magasanikbacteria bacterium CG10_big_fil_rev_8_21_14_0_10_43_6 TaxID=1974650 RepID=A0A2M6W196_9BACT|nr:MAG: hypothetical protein COU33_02435 [Candidatus Magasanikbacteria bacterium CG10_big_fil_rev_8_21_14_0_10_43_6]